VSPTLISNVTDALIEEVKAWQARPLEHADGTGSVRGILIQVHKDCDSIRLKTRPRNAD